MDYLQEIRLDRGASDRHNHRPTTRILSLSPRMVDMDSQLVSRNIFQRSSLKFRSILDCEFMQHHNVQARMRRRLSVNGLFRKILSGART